MKKEKTNITEAFKERLQKHWDTVSHILHEAEAENTTGAGKEIQQSEPPKKQVQFVNRNMILRAASEKVAEYMAQGYMISWNSGGFHVDLQKDNHYVRVNVKYKNAWLTRNNYDYLIRNLTLQVVGLPHAALADFETEDREPLYVRDFYAIDKNKEIYTDSPEEAMDVREKQRQRRDNNEHPAPVALTPSTGLIRLLKARKGFSGANRNNIRVTRMYDGYRVYLLNREGNSTRSEIFKLASQSA